MSDTDVKETPVTAVALCGASQEARDIFDSKYTMDFDEAEYLEENPGASFLEIKKAQSRHEAIQTVVVAKAIAICNGCVRLEISRREALELEDFTPDEYGIPTRVIFGVVGGLTQEARKQIFMNKR